MTQPLLQTHPPSINLGGMASSPPIIKPIKVIKPTQLKALTPGNQLPGKFYVTKIASGGGAKLEPFSQTGIHASNEKRPQEPRQLQTISLPTQPTTGQSVFPHAQPASSVAQALDLISMGLKSPPPVPQYSSLPSASASNPVYTAVPIQSYYDAQLQEKQQHRAQQAASQLSIPANTYLVQEGQITGAAFITTTKADPKTVHWLIDNFEVYEGMSLARNFMYRRYLSHCHRENVKPMGMASLGKLVRSVFLGLKTRRLGKRGDSKYHYYGLRVKPESDLLKEGAASGRDDSETDGEGPGGKRMKMERTAALDRPEEYKEYLGAHPQKVPVLKSVEEVEDPPEGVSAENVKAFETNYYTHCQSIMDALRNLQFDALDDIWTDFWERHDGDLPQADDTMSAELFYKLCELPQVQRFTESADFIFYQALVSILIPDVLRPIPTSLTQQIRNFAKTLETSLKIAMSQVPKAMLDVKMGAVVVFAQTLRRYTSLNHLAQAARAVLQNNQQVSQMMTDISRVDFKNIQEQAGWVCRCDATLVFQLESEFKGLLAENSSLERWAEWMQSLVESVLARSKPDAENSIHMARQLLTSWSFYSSLVIRDLTLRSAASFGSFHLIRLLYDEYIFYVVENLLARKLGRAPIAVMAQFKVEMSSMGNFEVAMNGEQLSTTVTQQKQQQAVEEAAAAASVAEN